MWIFNHVCVCKKLGSGFDFDIQNTYIYIYIYIFVPLLNRIKNLNDFGCRWLLQNYWFKVPPCHISLRTFSWVLFDLCWVTVFSLGIPKNRQMGANSHYKKRVSTAWVGYLPPTPMSRVCHIFVTSMALLYSDITYLMSRGRDYTLVSHIWWDTYMCRIYGVAVVWYHICVESYA